MEARLLKQAVKLTLVAGFVACGITASSASAANFTAASYPVTYSGSQDLSALHEFIADGHATSCKSAEFSGQAVAASSTATLTPTYSECVTSGLMSTVAMNGCDYLLHLTSATSTNVDLVCPAGKSVKITAAGGICVIHVSPFTNKSHVAVSNGAGGTIKAVATVSGISASLTDESIFCALTGSTTVTNATYSGNLTISGSSALSVD